jgi:glutamate 5-kinase
MIKIAFRKDLPFVKTIVVKTGSRILTTTGNEARVGMLVEDLVRIQKSGIRVILVSSGAIAHGMRALGLSKRPSIIPLQQACASIGQNRLMQMYESHFSKHDTLIGQVLLTWDDLRSKKRYLNLRNTLFQLLDCNVIPIVNENDSVGVEEIQFGNNDMLGAQVSLLSQADVFVNLTDVGGIFDRNPHEDKSAVHIPVVTDISSVFKYTSEKKTEISVGGMSTKLKAAEIVTRAGIFALIGNGYDQRLADVLNNEKCATLFLPSSRRMSSRHRWIAFTGQSKGSIIVDDGASKAIHEKGKSLLPAGVKQINGVFKSGDKVEIQRQDGKVIGRGLVNFSSDELAIIKGCKSSEVSSKLGQKQFDEVIHRDNLVVL